ncbi:MAG TPA: tripartite tricarboxylate transporter substrate binding protein, partial [Caldimonas sp.]|nr:tripartite tricarboxylate transporter substrate binding protein [Caldimonas sp.]
MNAPLRRHVLAALGGGLCAAALRPAWAQSTFPDRPIKLTVPYPPGALTDALGRMVAERLRVGFGQPVIVENKAGAGTLLGAASVAKSAPDGYQLLIATSTTLAISPAMFSSPAAVPGDFAGVAMIGSVSLLLVTRPDLKVASLPELVALMRREPGKYSYGSPGNGTMHQLLVEMIKVQEKVQATHIPYQGSMTALRDLLTGRIDFMFLDVVAALPQVKAGKINAIAVSAAHRLPALPDVPTVA